MKLYTIGFTQKTAERFFTLLRDNGVERVIDIRLRPGGQLAGFAKQADLAYFLDKLLGCEYHHLPQLAPTDEILDGYRHDKDWAKYERQFKALLDERDIPRQLDRRLFTDKVACLLCGEPSPARCHRRLVAERLAQYWPDLEVVHL